MRAPNRQQLRLSGGAELSFITAGESSRPAVLLLHGTPQSARYFRDVMPELSRAAYVIAPDLPGFGESDVLPTASFPAYGPCFATSLTSSSAGVTAPASVLTPCSLAGSETIPDARATVSPLRDDSRRRMMTLGHHRTEDFRRNC